MSIDDVYEAVATAAASPAGAPERAAASDAARSPLGAERLLAPLPSSVFVTQPEEFDRFVVRLLPDGSIYFKGTRERIADFLTRCAAAGLQLHVQHVSLCG